MVSQEDLQQRRSDIQQAVERVKTGKNSSVHHDCWQTVGKERRMASQEAITLMERAMDSALTIARGCLCADCLGDLA